MHICCIIKHNFIPGTNPCACQKPLFKQTRSSNLYLFPYLGSRAGSSGSLFKRSGDPRPSKKDDGLAIFTGRWVRSNDKTTRERCVDLRAHQPSPVHEEHMDQRDNKLGAVVVVSIYGINHSNNDVEGWHFRLNRQASGKSQLSSYILVKLLHKEARLT